MSSGPIPISDNNINVEAQWELQYELTEFFNGNTTPALFHSWLQTYFSHKSFTVDYLSLSGLTPQTVIWIVFWVVLVLVFSCFSIISSILVPCDSLSYRPASFWAHVSVKYTLHRIISVKDNAIAIQESLAAAPLPGSIHRPLDCKSDAQSIVPPINFRASRYIDFYPSVRLLQVRELFTLFGTSMKSVAWRC